MAIVSLGKISIVNTVPAQFTSTVNTNANAVYIQFPNGQTGPNVYIGAKGLVISTLANVWRILVKRAAATDVPDSWNPQSAVSVGPFDLSTFYVDGDHTGDYILVRYLVA